MRILILTLRNVRVTAVALFFCENIEKELVPVFGYERWENFSKVIDKTILYIQNAQKDANYYLREVTKMLTIGKNSVRSVKR